MSEPKAKPSSPPNSGRFAVDAAVLINANLRADRQVVEATRERALVLLTELRKGNEPNS